MLNNKKQKSTRLTLTQILGDAIIQKLTEKRKSSPRLTLEEMLSSEHTIRKQIR